MACPDLPRAQRLSDRFAHLDWPSILNRYARLVVPQLDDVPHGCQYYWVAAQAEYSADVMFKTGTGLRERYPRLLSHSTLCFGAEELMNFLGRKLTGRFDGEVVSDLSRFACRRVGGSRIKHRVKKNWMKMYDKAGLVLRVETVINNPEEFRVRKQVLRDGKQRAEWVALRKGVAYLFRYREVSLQANARYLDALAAVDDPTPGKQALQRLTSTKKDAAGRSCPGFNPMAQHDATLFKSVMAGEHCPTGRLATPAAPAPRCRASRMLVGAAHQQLVAVFGRQGFAVQVEQRHGQAALRSGLSQGHHVQAGVSAQQGVVAAEGVVQGARVAQPEMRHAATGHCVRCEAAHRIRRRHLAVVDDDGGVRRH